MSKALDCEVYGQLGQIRSEEPPNMAMGSYLKQTVYEKFDVVFVLHIFLALGLLERFLQHLVS